MSKKLSSKFNIGGSYGVKKEAVMPLFVTFVNVQGSHEYSCIEKPYKVLKLYNTEAANLRV